jgi:hypothetical protein
MLWCLVKPRDSFTVYLVCGQQVSAMRIHNDWTDMWLYEWTISDTNLRATWKTTAAPKAPAFPFHVFLLSVSYPVLRTDMLFQRKSSFMSRSFRLLPQSLFATLFYLIFRPFTSIQSHTHLISFCTPNFLHPQFHLPLPAMSLYSQGQ